MHTVALEATAYVPVRDFFSIGIGPSSSHTVGPLRAARAFAAAAARRTGVAEVRAVLFGSLAATGAGHGTDDAIAAGWAGLDEETCDPAVVRGALPRAVAAGGVLLDGRVAVRLGERPVERARGRGEGGHPNTVEFVALDADGGTVLREVYASIGGGFVRRVGDDEAERRPVGPAAAAFTSAATLLEASARLGGGIDDVARAHELADGTADELDATLDRVWAAMSDTIDRGLATGGVLPGGLGVRRRAPLLAAAMASEPDLRLQAYALAVNEENAAGSRIVTAPTNGAAGILPAVGRAAIDADPALQGPPMRRFLLAAAAIGGLIKRGAAISGAEGGCQAEVGSACAMAAAGLATIRGGTPAQVENAAEIVLEHHLGLTCDPVGGLVQIPCIERNAIAAGTAMTAARLALAGDGAHVVDLDTVIETMRQTGRDMSTKYKETSLGGLAVNVVAC